MRGGSRLKLARLATVASVAATAEIAVNAISLRRCAVFWLGPCLGIAFGTVRISVLRNQRVLGRRSSSI
jgi:hypothetical protein